MADSLRVHVAGHPVGNLAREQGQYVFGYDDGARAEDFASLTMPVRVRDYVHPRLHPVFEMQLPEGWLLAMLKRHFSKLVGSDDFDLLGLLAGAVRGRLGYSAPTTPGDALTLDELLHPDGRALFEELAGRFALQSVVSGVQPKVLAPVRDKASLRLEQYIVKAWGPEYPQLALNEYWCMRVVQAAGVDVPLFHLSDDAALFIMKRFDVLDDGSCLGFEDMCVLQVRAREQKYAGSCEQIARSIAMFVSPAHKLRALQQFFKLTVLNQRLQNGDAHLKNFGLLYSGVDDIRLAPAYDVVSTTIYVRNDLAALPLLGSRKWWPREPLLRFGMQACGLTRMQVEALYDECLAAMRAVADEMTARLPDTQQDGQRELLEHLIGLCRSAPAA